MQIDFIPSSENAFGVALLAGRVVGTVVGSTGHITVRATCKAKGANGRWNTVPFADATHVFFDVPSAEGDWADKIGTLYPAGTGEKWAGHYFEDRAQTDAKRLAAAKYLMRTIAGEIAGEHIQKSERCARCSKELTHPDSIFAMFGPECIKKVAAYMPNRSGTPEGAHESKTPGAVEPDAEPIEVLSDLSDDELDTAMKKATERFSRTRSQDDDRRLMAIARERTRRYVERDAATGYDAGYDPASSVAPTAPERARFLTNTSNHPHGPRAFEPPKPASDRVEKVAMPRATSDQIVAVLKRGDDPKKVLAELEAR